jgi:hypothetical protein
VITIFQFLRLYSAPRQVLRHPKDRSTSTDPAASGPLMVPDCSGCSDFTTTAGRTLTGRTTEYRPDTWSLRCRAPTLWHRTTCSSSSLTGNREAEKGTENIKCQFRIDSCFFFFVFFLSHLIVFKCKVKIRKDKTLNAISGIGSKNSNQFCSTKTTDTKQHCKLNAL